MTVKFSRLWTIVTWHTQYTAQQRSATPVTTVLELEIKPSLPWVSNFWQQWITNISYLKSNLFIHSFIHSLVHSLTQQVSYIGRNTCTQSLSNMTSNLVVPPLWAPGRCGFHRASTLAPPVQSLWASAEGAFVACNKLAINQDCLGRFSWNKNHFLCNFILDMTM